VDWNKYCYNKAATASINRYIKNNPQTSLILLIVMAATILMLNQNVDNNLKFMGAIKPNSDVRYEKGGNSHWIMMGLCNLVLRNRMIFCLLSCVVHPWVRDCRWTPIQQCFSYYTMTKTTYIREYDADDDVHFATVRGQTCY
jgi:hypothetical protein